MALETTAGYYMGDYPEFAIDNDVCCTTCWSSASAHFLYDCSKRYTYQPSHLSNKSLLSHGQCGSVGVPPWTGEVAQ